MIKLPSVLGMVLCDRMDWTSRPGQVSLVDVFQSRHFATFPTPAQRFTVYTALYDGVGEGTMEMLISRLETEQDILQIRRWCTFPGRSYTVNLETLIRNCEFPAPGQYSLSLKFDNRELALRYLRTYRG